MRVALIDVDGHNFPNINDEFMEDCTIACQLLTWNKQLVGRPIVVRQSVVEKGMNYEQLYG